jgi:hypothetical protein
MQYMLTLYADESGFTRMSPEEQQKGLAAYMAYSEALTKAGAMKASGRLGPSSSATRVRLVDGKPSVLDGPFIESKEQLGGYFLIDVADLDAALGWAARCPGAGHGVVEVRPMWAM